MNDPFTTLQPMAGETFYLGFDAEGNSVAIYGPNTEEFKNAVYGTNTGPYAANADALRFPSESTIAPIKPGDNFDANNAQKVFYSEPTTVMQYNTAVNNAKTSPPTTPTPTPPVASADVDAVTGASANPGSLLAEDVITRTSNPYTLVNSTDPDSANYLQINAIRSGDDALYEYGFMENYSVETNTYHYVNSETGRQTFVNLENNEIMVAEEVNGQTIVTIYTTDEETSGYSINATSLGLKVNPDGTLSDENGDFTVSLSAGEIRDLYNETTSPSYNGGTFYSGAYGLDDIGTFDYTGSSENNVEYHPDFYRSPFNALLIRNGYQSLITVDSYTDYLEVAEKYDIFETESVRFDNTINTMIDNNDGEWKAIDTALNGVLDQYKDLFNVGGKNISDLVGPVKEALSSAQSQITSYLEEISKEYSAVSSRKEAELRRLAELARKQTGSSAN